MDNICRRKSDGHLFTATVRKGYTAGNAFADMFDSNGPGWYFQRVVWKDAPRFIRFLIKGWYVRTNEFWETKESITWEILKIDGKWKKDKV